MVIQLDHVDHAGDGRERSPQLVGKHGNDVVSHFPCDLDRSYSEVSRLLNIRALADIADVALDHTPGADIVDIADELHRNYASASGPERMVFIADVFIGLELSEGGLIRVDVVEKADLPKLEADDAFKRVVEQVEEERIYIDDSAVLAIENQDPVLRGFK